MRARLRWLGLGVVLLCMILAGCGGTSSTHASTATATAAMTTTATTNAVMATATTAPWPITATATPWPITANVYYATSDQILSALDPATGAVRWTFSRGEDIMNPILVGNLVYVTAFSGQSTTIYALNSMNGAVVWSAPGWRPILADKALYIEAGSTVYCLDAATGKQRWQRLIPATLLTVAGDTVYASTATLSSTRAPLSSTLTALDRADGAIRWSFTRNNEGFDNPEIENGVVYFMSRSGDTTGPPVGRLYALNAADGSLRWNVGVGASANSNTFALSDGEFYAGGSATGITAFRTSDGAQLWTNTDPMFSYFIVVGKVVYVKSFNSAAVALDGATGKQLWATSVLVSSPATPPTAANGLLYISGGRGPGQVAAITMSTGIILWIQQMPGTAGFPVIAGDSIYVYTMQPDNGPSPVIYAFNAASGKLLWEHQMGKNLVTGFTVTGEVGNP